MSTLTSIVWEPRVVLLSSWGVKHAVNSCRLRSECYALARMQPALEDSMCKRADVAALAGTLHRRKASALTVMQTAQPTRSALPALLSAQNDNSLLRECQYHGLCLPYGSLGRLWPHTYAVQGPDAWPSLQGVQTHKASSREAPCCGTPPPEGAQNICKILPAARQDEITALTKTGQDLCPCRMLATGQPIGVQTGAIARRCILISTTISVPLA